MPKLSILRTSSSYTVSTVLAFEVPTGCRTPSSGWRRLNRSNHPRPACPLTNGCFILLRCARVKVISITFFLIEPSSLLSINLIKHTSYSSVATPKTEEGHKSFVVVSSFFIMLYSTLQHTISLCRKFFSTLFEQLQSPSAYHHRSIYVFSQHPV